MKENGKKKHAHVCTASDRRRLFAGGECAGGPRKGTLLELEYYRGTRGEKTWGGKQFQNLIWGFGFKLSGALSGGGMGLGENSSEKKAGPSYRSWPGLWGGGVGSTKRPCTVNQIRTCFFRAGEKKRRHSQRWGSTSRSIVPKKISKGGRKGRSRIRLGMGEKAKARGNEKPMPRGWKFKPRGEGKEASPRLIVRTEERLRETGKKIGSNNIRRKIVSMPRKRGGYYRVESLRS